MTAPKYIAMMHTKQAIKMFKVHIASVRHSASEAPTDTVYTMLTAQADNLERWCDRIEAAMKLDLIEFRERGLDRD